MSPLPHRYPISTLDCEDHDVFLTVGEKEVIGRVRFTDTGKARYQVRVSRTVMEDVPRFALVALWRPANPSTWPFLLPEPASITPQRQTPIPAPETRAGGDFEDDGDIPRGLYVGRPGETPTKPEEVRVRIIRCLRTRAVLEREVTKTETLWPKPWQDEAQIRHKQLAVSPTGELVGLRMEDYDDFFVDKSALNARPVRFEPTHRDVSDYEASIDQAWLSLIPRHDRSLFHARAKLPPMDWWQIADAERVDEYVIRERYGKALTRILRRLKR